MLSRIDRFPSKLILVSIEGDIILGVLYYVTEIILRRYTPVSSLCYDVVTPSEGVVGGDADIKSFPVAAGLQPSTSQHSLRGEKKGVQLTYW